jgi:hypothetical protein
MGRIMHPFKKLQGMLQGKGYSKESAGAIAYSAGKKKFGNQTMKTAAKEHVTAQSVANRKKK